MSPDVSTIDITRTAHQPEEHESSSNTTEVEQLRSGGKFDALLALAGTGKGIWNEDAVEYQRRLRGSL